MSEELENELIEEDVPETSNEGLEEVKVSTSDNDETVQDKVTEVIEPDVDIEKMVEERANKLFEEKVEERLIRDRKARERKQAEELSKYRHLESIAKTGLGVENIDEAISQMSDFYKEQGINIPSTYDQYSERDERILAEADAQEIIELGKEEMEAEANRIASIEPEKRSVRERVMFDTLCHKLISLRDIEELKSKGHDANILNSEDFMKFRDQFNVNTSISKIYDMYNKINGQKVEKPKSPGSAKTTSTTKQIKNYYSPEEFDNLTEEELNDPKIMAIVDKSRLQWYKE